MENENTEEIIDSTNNDEQVVDEIEEDTTDWKAEALKLRGITKRLETKLEKAKDEVKENVKIVAPELPAEPVKSVSTADILALTRANVVEEDIADIEDYAKYKGISIAEALKTTVVKTLLADKAEQRKTAQQTNVQTTRRGAVKPTPEDILEKARKGDLPETEEGIAALYQAGRQEKLNRNK